MSRSVNKWVAAMARVDLPVLVLAGFLVSSLVFFFRPVFLNPAQSMLMPRYVPSLDPIGIDMKQFIDYVYAWWKDGDPYISTNAHPPLMHVFFLPAMWAGPRRAYQAMTLINLALFPLTIFVFPMLLKRRGQITALMMLFAVSGLFSYGYQFELERGQFNLFTTSICLLSIYIFRAHPRWRYLALLLFSFAVQLKLYPAIFALFFVEDWRAWKRNVLLLASLGAFNVACLFALGPRVFVSFLKAAKAQAGHPFVWEGNASIRSYTILYGHAWAATPILVLFLTCLGALVFIEYRRRAKGIALALLVCCAVGAILIPSVSHDYKLSFLILPALLFFEGLRLPAVQESAPLGPTLNRLAQNALVFFAAAAYTATLFSYEYKPLSFNLKNNLPVLLSLLVIVTLFSILQHATTPADSRDYVEGRLLGASA